MKRQLAFDWLLPGNVSRQERKIERKPIREIPLEMHAAMIAAKYMQLCKEHFHPRKFKVCGTRHELHKCWLGRTEKRSSPCLERDSNSWQLLSLDRRRSALTIELRPLSWCALHLDVSSEVLNETLFQGSVVDDTYTNPRTNDSTYTNVTSFWPLALRSCDYTLTCRSRYLLITHAKGLAFKSRG